METQHQKSVHDILNSPGFLKFECTIRSDTCASCVHKCSPAKIRQTRSKILSDFDGLCLDCMDLSRPKGDKDIDMDYWHHDVNQKWDSTCRISHSQPTWYFSFMGRRAEMKIHQNKKNEAFQERRRNHELRCDGDCFKDWCRV